MKIVLFVMMAAGLGACGGGSSVDNEASCQAFVDKVKCGSVDISSQVDCSAYKAASCDLQPYFDCLETHYVCDNGQYDSAAMATIGDCASKSACK